MASGKNIQTYFNGEWKSENTPIMKAADHGTWLGTSVFDVELVEYFVKIVILLKENLKLKSLCKGILVLLIGQSIIMKPPDSGTSLKKQK